MNTLALCKSWQKKLRLQEWDVIFHILDDEEMNGEESNHGFAETTTNGFVMPYYYKRVADIYIRKSGPHIEETIIHELTHLHVAEVNEFMIELIKHIGSKDLQAQFQGQRNLFIERVVYTTARIFE